MWHIGNRGYLCTVHKNMYIVPRKWKPKRIDKCRLVEVGLISLVCIPQYESRYQKKHRSNPFFEETVEIKS